MSISIQRFTLPANQDHARIPLNDNILPPTAWKCKSISFVRNKPTWVEAKTYPTLASHPDLASSLVLLKSPDWHHTFSIYPVSTLSANCNLVFDPKLTKGFLNVRRCRPGNDEEVYVVRGRTSGNAEVRKVVKIAVKAARKLVGGRDKVIMPSAFWDELGICTYESLRHEDVRPSKDRLLKLVPSYPIKTFLIDDGWEDVSASRCLRSFGAWEGMGGSLGEVVSELKSRGVEEVGVWVTLQGYWLSIDKDSNLIKTYDCRPFKTARPDQPRGGVHIPLEAGKGEQWMPSPEKAGAFWVDWFMQLKDAGIGFVKVDNQAHYDIVTGDEALHFQQAMWGALLEAVEKVWASTDRVIMCMSHNERMLNGPGGLDCERPAGNLVFRNSDDFNLSYENAHPDFIHFNTYMSILTHHLSFVPDFDMFATAPQSRWPDYHAFLRALCPGPTLVSDTPDITTDMGSLNRLTAKTKQGKIKVVKTDTPAVALPGRWFWDNLQGNGDGPAIIASVHVPSAHGSIVGAWNCRNANSQSWAKDRLSLLDIQEALEVDQLEHEYVLWCMRLSDRSDKYRLVRPGEKVAFGINLARSDCEGVVISRVWDVAGRKVAILGMLDKYAPLAGLTVSLLHDPTRRYVNAPRPTIGLGLRRRFSRSPGDD